MREDVLLTDIIDSPWERQRRAALAQLGPAWGSAQLSVDIGWTATVCAAAASRAVDEVLGVPEYMPDEISEAIDVVAYPRTVRVATDCSWQLERP